MKTQQVIKDALRG